MRIESNYRVAHRHHVGPNLPLTSKQKFRYKLILPYFFYSATVLGPTSLSSSDQPVAGEAGESDSGGLEKAMEGLGLENKAKVADDKKQTLADLAAASSNSTSTNTFGINRQG